MNNPSSLLNSRLFLLTACMGLLFLVLFLKTRQTCLETETALSYQEGLAPLQANSFEYVKMSDKFTKSYVNAMNTKYEKLNHYLLDELFLLDSLSEIALEQPTGTITQDLAARSFLLNDSCRQIVFRDGYLTSDTALYQQHQSALQALKSICAADRDLGVSQIRMVQVQNHLIAATAFRHLLGKFRADGSWGMGLMPRVQYDQLSYQNGDTVRAQVRLSGYNFMYKIDSIMVNGISLATKEGKLQFEYPNLKPGTTTLEVQASIYSYETGERFTAKRTYRIYAKNR
jgi:hypothetical protein